MQRVIKYIMHGLMFFVTVNYLGCGSSPLTTKVYDQSALEYSKSILIKDFSFKDGRINFKGDMDSLSHVFSMYIQKEIQELKSRLLISGLSGDTATTDIILDGKFLIVDEGDSAGRVLLGSGGATVSVQGAINTADGKVLADFSKSKTSAGGPLGMGGMLSGSGSKIINDILEDIAEDLAEFIVKNTKGE